MITIVGIGYVGEAVTLNLLLNHEINCVDINEDKLNKFKDNIAYNDDKIHLYKNLEDVPESKFIIYCLPTNFEETCFNTDILTNEINKGLEKFPKSIHIIKSTVPVGYSEIFNNDNILFSPEFLREGTAIEDFKNPDRTIIGYRNKELAKEYMKLIFENTNCENFLLTSLKEAETIKLFSNTYLAMRVAFFNELDTFCEKENMNSLKVISGICMDNRIGMYYNNPSFGYGGYCLPKDTKQVYSQTKSKFIKAIIDSNHRRKNIIAENALSKVSNILDTRIVKIGIYRLIMKEGSDNFRESAILDVIKHIQGYEMMTDIPINIIIYEPLIEEYEHCIVNNNLESFKKECDIILANRIEKELLDIKEKIYTRSIF